MGASHISRSVTDRCVVPGGFDIVLVVCLFSLLALFVVVFVVGFLVCFCFVLFVCLFVFVWVFFVVFFSIGCTFFMKHALLKCITLSKYASLQLAGHRDQSKKVIRK